MEIKEAKRGIENFILRLINENLKKGFKLLFYSDNEKTIMKKIDKFINLMGEDTEITNIGLTPQEPHIFPVSNIDNYMLYGIDFEVKIYNKKDEEIKISERVYFMIEIKQNDNKENENS